MSREIKFRAWDGETMIYDVVPSPFYPGVDNPDRLDVIREIKDYEPEYYNMVDILEGVEAIEQYTGLKDKNDIEIYEGDIVALLDKHVFIEDSWMCVKGVVEYGVERKGFVVVPAVDEDYDFLLTDKTMCVVIGNIHEEVKNENKS